MRRIGLVSLLGATLAFGGCMNDAAPDMDAEEASAPAMADAKEMDDEASGGSDASVAKKAKAGAEVGATEQRKIIYTADVSLDVKNVEETGKKIEALVKELHGYVAKANSWGSADEGRSAHWTLRIPVAKFDGALGKLQKLGDVTQVGKDSKDVTAEYIDLETRLKNKKIQEERLRELLKQSNKLADTLKLEQELARVRSEIESWQGQLNVLKNQVTLATIEVSAREDRTAFGAVLAGAFGGIVGESFKIFVASGRGLVLFLAAVVPWAVPLGFLVAWMLRKRRARKAQQTPPPAGGEPENVQPLRKAGG